MEDLDDIWAAQIGQHEAIVKNVHDLLAKLAWDFTPPQMDHLFERFHSSWSTANAKQREKLLELIRHLAEDDKEGVMADKVSYDLTYRNSQKEESTLLHAYVLKKILTAGRSCIKKYF